MDILGRSRLQIVALVRSPELGKDLVAAVNPHNGTKISVQVGELKAVGTKLAKQGSPDVLIVDIDPEDAGDMAVLKDLTQLGSGTKVPVVATAGSISPMMLRRLLRDGVDDFIPQPVTAPEVSEALRTAIAKYDRPARKDETARGAVVTFM